MKSPATLSPDDTDATIFDVIAREVALRTLWDGDTPVAIWSRAQDRWLNPAEYAAEWRHKWRYRQVMGSEEEARAVSDYERTLGL